MFRHPRQLLPLAERGPLRVLFLLTSMPVGGAETLLVNLLRRLDRQRFLPEVCCLKEPGPLGVELSHELPVHCRLLSHKFDLRVLGRLSRLLGVRRSDAVVTVGAGDKMFWGRLAAWRTGVPVVLSALHSTGWPDRVGTLNRLLTPLTDAFIAVAAAHGRYLTEHERFPAAKVRVIPNGVDIQRFRPQPAYRAALRRQQGLSLDAPVCGIVAALRPEKNHALFLQAAALVQRALPATQFVIVGDGPVRPQLEAAARELGLTECTHFLGTRSDIPEILAMLDLFALTSHIEANPVSILEAMAAGLPVVATRVGSVAESVVHGATGYLADPGDAAGIAHYWLTLLRDPDAAHQMGEAGRTQVVAHGSLETMVEGYQSLLAETYQRKCVSGGKPADQDPTLAREIRAAGARSGWDTLLPMKP